MLCVVIALLKAWHPFKKYTRYEWPLLNVRHGLNGNYKKEVFTVATVDHPKFKTTNEKSFNAFFLAFLSTI